MRIPSLYICSIEGYCGKSMISLGLALTFREEGLKIGYFKPVGWEMSRDSKGRKIDEDAQLMKDALDLKSPLEVISPIILSSRFLEETLKLNTEDCRKRVLQAYEEASNGMDLTLIEGSESLGLGTSIGIDCVSLTKKLGSHIILVSMVENDSAVDKLILYKNFIEVRGGDLIGAVLNRIPKTHIERVKGYAAPILRRHGLEVLGVIPDSISLRSPTVGDICENIPCSVLTGEDRMDLLVEELLVGAMNPESALSYFRRSMRKAVITGGDRADIQLAALQTDTSVLILTGNIYPDVRILAKAEELGVPVLLVSYDTYTTIKEIANLLGRIKPRDSEKIELAKSLVKKNVSWKLILDSLIKTGE